MPNDFGLPRDIGRVRERQVRQECGFGCVICGKAPYHYDHVEHDYAEIDEHDPADIALLCGTHHDEKTRRWLPPDEVKRARRTPRALVDGFSRQALYPGVDDYMVIVGDAWFPDARQVLQVHGRTLLGVEPPEEPGAPLRVTASFYDENGRSMLLIQKNEIVYRANNWDIEIEGPTVTVRNALRDIQLVLATVAGRGLRVDRLKMAYRGVRFDADEKSLAITVNGRPAGTFSCGVLISGPLTVPAPLMPQVRMLWEGAGPFDRYGYSRSGL